MKKHRINIWLVATFFSLMLIGIIMVYSASAFYAQKYFDDHFYFLKRHLFQLFIGLIAMAAAFSFPYKKLTGHTWIFLLISLFILFYTAFISRGRWVYIGPLHFQAVDVAKFAIILFFADSLSRKEKMLSRYSEGYLIHLFYLMTFAFLVLRQPDFSSAAVLMLIGLTILFAAPIKVSLLALTGLALFPLMAMAVMISPYKLNRLTAFLNPSDDLQGIGYQVHQSLISLGHGGVTGVGFAGSTQKMFFLPEAHTDFIFAIIGEEWGLIGTLIVIALFGIILYQGIKTINKTKDRFYVYLAIGVTAHFVYYAMINMMVTLRLLPATGLPLPFISYGGTALVLSCVYAGILLKIASDAPRSRKSSSTPRKKRRVKPALASRK